MKKSKIDYNYIFMILVLLVLCLFPSFTNTYTSAEERVYSGVLEDLQKDEDFNIDNYPVIENDYSLQVIQIAESNENELFVYTYQPMWSEYATSINISTGINDNLKYENYTLSYINHSSTLYKYKVDNFVVKEDSLRYYDISSIFREWDVNIDGVLAGDNIGVEKSYKVAKLYTASTVNNNVTYVCNTSEVIEITNKHVGFIRYLNGFWLWEESCDSHYVAFSTDRPIEKLMEADITYIAQVGSGSMATGSFHVDSTETVSDIINPETVSNDPSGPFGHKYTWNRIEKVSDFIANKDNDLTEETKKELEGMTWVLRFKETPYTEYNGLYNPHYDATRISEVTILRLKFETNGDVYNLGVVDNKQTGDVDPDNNPYSWLKELFKWFFRIIGIILLVVLIVACWPIVSVVLSAILKAAIWLIKMIGKGLGYFFYGLWWVISSPIALFDEDGA